MRKLIFVLMTIPLAMANLTAQSHFNYVQKVRFSQMEWGVKKYNERVGPGNNWFGMHAKNVVVDKKGYLTLAVRKVKQGWSCAEVVSEQVVGEGKYEFEVLGNFDKMPANLVFGLFLYNYNHIPYHDEVDIELSRWGNGQNLNAQFVVHQHGGMAKHRFGTPKGKISLFFTIEVTQNELYFSMNCLSNNKNSENCHQTYVVPKPNEMSMDDLRIRLNLWLMEPDMFRKRYPQIIVKKVRYTPSIK